MFDKKPGSKIGIRRPPPFEALVYYSPIDQCEAVAGIFLLFAIKK
jgi:hypothetical protein